jgi:hypothetical protein
LAGLMMLSFRSQREIGDRLGLTHGEYARAG